MPIKSLTAVFAHTDGTVGIFFMELIEPRPVHIGLAAVPTEIVIVRQNVGNPDILLARVAHTEHRYCGGARRVDFMHQIIEHTVISISDESDAPFMVISFDKPQTIMLG